MWLRRFIGLPVIAVIGALIVTACAKPNPYAANPLPIVVPEDAQLCTVVEQLVPCAAIPEHLVKTLQAPTTKPIILSDQKTGRTDDAVTRLVAELKKAGYGEVIVVGVITERP
jgi:hypothetical protein